MSERESKPKPPSALSVDPPPTGPVSPSAGRPVVRRRELSLDEYAAGVLGRDRSVLARAITLIESNSRRHIERAQELLTRLMPHTGKAYRVGITGVPGAGKSTFIESFGLYLTAAGHHVAVLAIDPSSNVTGGSILGDKTRMIRLSNDPGAFIRPSPTAGTLGGVASKTRESMLLCEAAGYDVVLIETVGVGQSETVVADMTDFFLAIMIPGAGDELQGIKRGLFELTDLIAVNKADGDNVTAADRAAIEYRNAVHFMRPRVESWAPPVLTCSARKNTGLEEIWQKIVEHRTLMDESGVLHARRREQMLRWMWTMVDEQLRSSLKAHPDVQASLPRLEQDIRAGKLPPTLGARLLLKAFGVLKT